MMVCCQREDTQEVANRFKIALGEEQKVAQISCLCIFNLGDVGWHMWNMFNVIWELHHPGWSVPYKKLNYFCYIKQIHAGILIQLI